MQKLGFHVIMNERMSISDKMPEVKSQNPVPKIRRKAEPSHSMNSSVDSILFLQRTIGNQAVQRLLISGIIQAKLKIGAPNEIYEQEADSVADMVMRMPEETVVNGQPSVIRKEDESVQIKPTSASGYPLFKEEELIQPKLRITPLVQKQVEEEEEKEILKTKEVSGYTPEVSHDIESRINEMKGDGQPLSESVRNYFEPRFGYDFSKVRVHTGAKAAESAWAINAVAYTVGRNIVLGAGKSLSRDGLTAHELTHVLQQTGDIGPAAVRASTIPSSVVQRQCTGDVGNPISYATEARASNLRCDEANTGISDVTRRITEGRGRARVMINDALTVLNRMLNGSTSTDAMNQFRRLFGLSPPQPTPPQIHQAIRTYNTICSWLTSSNAQQGRGIICLTQGIGLCRGRYIAEAACSSTEPLYLCPGAISPNSLDTAETIIHEAAHRFGICTRPPPGSPAGTSRLPERYKDEPGFPTSPALTTSADSYSAFAREAHNLMGIERVQEQRRREREEGMEERPVQPRQRTRQGFSP
jgi:hypothetical protein